MASPDLVMSLGSLRSLTVQLANLSPEGLSLAAPRLATTIWNCKNVLSMPLDAKNSSYKAISAEFAPLLVRLKTQLSSFLRHTDFHARWAGVVLLKATLEAGGLEMLVKPKVIIQNLLGIMQRKSDPPTTRMLTHILLTRIFMLTWADANLVRELTTPALPAMITACLQTLESGRRCTAGEVQAILETFALLLPRHPTIFRTHEARIKALILPIIAGSARGAKDGSLCHFSTTHKHAARRVWALLQHTVAKQNATESWEAAWKSTLSAAHATCDRIFRGIHETWESTSGVNKTVSPEELLEKDVGVDGDALGLPGWKGMAAGVGRLTDLLSLLREQLLAAPAVPVRVRLGGLSDLMSRILSVLPSDSTGKATGVQANSAITREERSELFSYLPKVHAGACEVVATLFDRFGSIVMPVAPIVIQDVVLAFPTHLHIMSGRAAFYDVVSKYLALLGPSLHGTDVAAFNLMLEAACRDVLPPIEIDTVQVAAASSASTTSAAEHSKNLGKGSNLLNRGTRNTAHTLLEAALSRLRAQYIPSKLRAQIDRAAVLTRDKSLLVASVLNPPRKKAAGAAANGFSKVQPSLLPILAREFPHDVEVEALLRPRMPVLRTTSDSRQSHAASNGEDEEEEEVDDDMDLDDENDVEQEPEDAAQLQDELHTADAQPQDADDDEPTSSLLQALASPTHERPAQASRPLNSVPLLNATKRSPAAASLDLNNEHSLTTQPLNSPTKRVRFDDSHDTAADTSASTLPSSSSQSSLPPRQAAPHITTTIIPPDGKNDAQTASRATEAVTVPASASVSNISASAVQGSSAQQNSIFDDDDDMGDSDEESAPLTMDPDSEDEASE